MIRLVGLLLACCMALSGCARPEPEAVHPPENPDLEASDSSSTPEPQSEQEVPESAAFTSCAYLPLSSLPDELSSFTSRYEQNLAALDHLIINTGVYWNEDGELIVSGSFDDAAQTLSEHLPLRCTINPRGALIREGIAGQTIDTTQKRQALADNIADFARTHSLSGIDIDWEFPLENEWDDFSAFIVTLDKTLENISPEISLSLALYPEEILLTKQAIDAADTVNIMAYDQFDANGFHSTMQTAVDAVDYFLSLGFESRQLVLGIPAYGRPLDGSAQWVLYNGIDLDAVPEGTPDLIGDIYFNSQELAAEKTQFAKENGLSGVMLYHLLCDRTDESSLTRAISQK